MASTPLLEAASSSWTSSEVPLAISMHEGHTPARLAVGGLRRS